tara:strand:- start:28 stop:255 length:228 start_codon:yes stop_codon:yes gene_type:complete
LEKLSAILSKILKIDKDEITDNMPFDKIKGWDSFNFFLLISELEKEFNVKFTIDEMIKFKSLKDIKDAFEKQKTK